MSWELVKKSRVSFIGDALRWRIMFCRTRSLRLSPISCLQSVMVPFTSWWELCMRPSMPTWFRTCKGWWRSTWGLFTSLTWRCARYPSRSSHTKSFTMRHSSNRRSPICPSVKVKPLTLRSHSSVKECPPYQERLSCCLASQTTSSTRKWTLGQRLQNATIIVSKIQGPPSSGIEKIRWRNVRTILAGLIGHSSMTRLSSAFSAMRLSSCARCSVKS